jgi:hypothetical protein
MLNKLIVAMLVLSFSVSAFSSSRVDETINESTDEQIKKIEDLQKSLNLGKIELAKVESQLVIAENESEDHRFYLKFRNQAALAAIASAVSIAGSFYLQEKRLAAFNKSGKYFSHPGNTETLLAVIGLSGFTVTSLATIGFEIGVLLTKDEVKSVQETMKSLENSLNLKTIELNKETKILCEKDQRNRGCYLIK